MTETVSVRRSEEVEDESEIGELRVVGKRKQQQKSVSASEDQSKFSWKRQKPSTSF
jgi:hypothetical protein